MIEAAHGTDREGAELYLIDTDVLIDVTKGREPALSWVAGALARRSILCSCAITIAEYFAGQPRGDYPARDAFIDSLLYLETPHEVAEAAGDYRRSFARRGIQLSTQDVIVAATARHHEAALVTRNRKDFPMEDVRVMSLAD